MNDSLTLGSWGAISRGCPMDYRIKGGDVAEFTFGESSSGGFEFTFDTDSLRELVKLGVEALAQMDELVAAGGHSA